MPRVFHTGVGFVCLKVFFLPLHHSVKWQVNNSHYLAETKEKKQHNLALIQSEEPRVTVETDVEFTLVLFLKTKTLRFILYNEHSFQQGRNWKNAKWLLMPWCSSDIL